ncbi:hypothetical protein LCGC14_2074330 [marine sediment metagenome]|uniref:Uncharacterized protein n=1 Tax=marine sediment metagenome TaxID=412755 RepID=A0A0F9EHB4_9ZZZZ
MSFISSPDDTVKVKLSDQEGNTATFDLKKILSKQDVNTAFEVIVESTREMARDRPTPDLAEGEKAPQLNLDMVLTLPMGQLAILKIALVKWDLEYPEGHPDYPAPIPLNEKAVESLAVPIVDQLCDHIKELNHVKTAEELANLESR